LALVFVKTRSSPTAPFVSGGMTLVPVPTFGASSCARKLCEGAGEGTSGPPGASCAGGAASGPAGAAGGTVAPGGVSMMVPGMGAARPVCAFGNSRARFASSASCLKLTFVRETGWMRVETTAGAGVSDSTGACGFVRTGACGLAFVTGAGRVFVVVSAALFVTGAGASLWTGASGFTLTALGRTCAPACGGVWKSAGGAASAVRSARRPSRRAALEPFLVMLGPGPEPG
jgi:hypothetical protein